MANIVRAALVQTAWTGDKESMVEKNVKYARDAAAQGAVEGPAWQRGGGNHGFYGIARLAPGATMEWSS